MKLKYNHDGVTLSIPLTDTKPTGKRFPVRHNGTTYYAPTVPVDDVTATDCTIVFDGQPCALSRGVAPNSVTLDGATEYNITAEDKQRGVTVTDFSNAVNITGLTFSDIKTCSYSGNTITLGLVGKVKIILPNATSNALLFNGTTVFVKDNFFCNNNDTTIATRFSLTAYNSAGIDESAIKYNDITIDASNVKKSVTIQSGGGGDLIISGTGNNSLKGNGGSDTFVYLGGNDTITDFTADNTQTDKISIAADGLLDFDNYIFSSKNVLRINGTTQGNSLTLLNVDQVKITGIDQNGNSKEYVYSYERWYTEHFIGTLNGNKTAITLYANATSFAPTATNYPKLATIDASAVSSAIAVRAVNNIASCLIASDKGMSLYGGSQGDTLISGKDNTMLIGGAGNDSFVHKGGKTTIVDYAGDKVNLANGKNMGDISGVKVDTAGATLTFGENDSIALQGIASTDAVTFTSANDTYGSGYLLENDKIRMGTRRGVTLTTEASYTIASGEVTVIANAGGTITGGEQAATLGGTNVSIIGGTGSEVFLYNGGTMRIANYDSANDRISLADGYTLQGKELITVDGNENFVLTIADSNNDTTAITVENTADLKSVKVNDKTIKLQHTTGEPLLFDTDTPSTASQVTITPANSEMVDFGVFKVNDTVETEVSTSIGTAFYASLTAITAEKENVTVVGNAKPSTFYITGGASNIITGGIGKDTFIFESGGGIITDFGIGITRHGTGKYLASSTKRTNTSTYVNYNRDNPTYYAEGSDELKVNGKVVEIAFRQDTADYDSSTESTFTAYVTYVDFGEYSTIAKYSTIALANINKNVLKADKAGGGANATYDSNATAAANMHLNIWDTSAGNLAQLTGTAYTKLLADKSNSPHSSAIAKLDAIIQARGITTYSAEGKITSVSNGIVAAKAAQ